jgi:hypothetical protein
MPKLITDVRLTHPTPTVEQLEKIESIKAQIARNHEIAAERDRRIADCEVEASDCALSMRANDSRVAQDEMRIKILEQGGYDLFPVVLDSDDNVVATSMVRCNGYMGGKVSKWVFDTPTGTVWLSDTVDHSDKGVDGGFSKRSKAHKMGYKRVMRYMPAGTDINGSNWFPYSYPKQHVGV